MLVDVTALCARVEARRAISKQGPKSDNGIMHFCHLKFEIAPSCEQILSLSLSQLVLMLLREPGWLGRYRNCSRLPQNGDSNFDSDKTFSLQPCNIDARFLSRSKPTWTRMLNYVCKWMTLLLILLMLSYDRLCGIVVRVPGYRSRGPGSIPGATRFSEK
jgi:hypothetical protein